MSELDNFISSLTDHELAFFFMYRYSGFLDKSKEKIDAEIGKRNLSPEKLKSLANIKLNSGSVNEFITCQRCGSEKLFIETDYHEIPLKKRNSKK